MTISTSTFGNLRPLTSHPNPARTASPMAQRMLTALATAFIAVTGGCSSEESSEKAASSEDAYTTMYDGTFGPIRGPDAQGDCYEATYCDWQLTKKRIHVRWQEESPYLPDRELYQDRDVFSWLSADGHRGACIAVKSIVHEVALDPPQTESLSTCAKAAEQLCRATAPKAPDGKPRTLKPAVFRQWCPSWHAASSGSSGKSGAGANTTDAGAATPPNSGGSFTCSPFADGDRSGDECSCNGAYVGRCYNNRNSPRNDEAMDLCRGSHQRQCK